MVRPVVLEEELFIARPHTEGKGGYTWTLASRLGQMLRQAEELFGDRDRSYTFVGVDFRDGVPQTWYPGGCRNVVIQLLLDVMREPVRALYQLAHECVHLLCPTGGRSANVLEEGLATYFQEHYVADTLQATVPHTEARYAAARDLVADLLKIDIGIVRELRRL